MELENITPYLDNSRLHLIIMPTEKCNFRCKYCYEKFENGLMNRETIEGIKCLIENRGRTLKRLEIGWFGGEPLLASDEVIEISNHSCSLSKVLGFEFYSSMSTNGSLLVASVFHDLIKAGVRVFQISIDGSSEYHDLTRIGATGRGTYETIMSNLEQMRQSSLPFSVALRLHVTSQNYDSFPLLAKHLEQKFGGDSRFKVYFKSIEDLGGPGSSAGIKLKSSQDIHQLESLFPSDMIAERSQSNPKVCYAAAGNSLVIRSTGDISKCTVALDNPLNVVGRINRDGTISSDSQRFGKWVSTLFRPNDARCPLISVGQ